MPQFNESKFGLSDMQQKAAWDLAVSYNAYNDAVATLGSENPDYSGIFAWGGMLLRAQADTGVELFKAVTIQNGINTASKVLHPQESPAA